MNKVSVAALSCLIMVGATFSTPAMARSNNNAMQQSIILNNLNTEQQNLLNQINTYVTAGQISPQQGASFSAELSQIAGQSSLAATNPAMTQQIIGQFSNLSAQINGALQPSGTFTTQSLINFNNPGVYENWHNRWMNERNKLGSQYRQDRLNYDQAAQTRALQDLQAQATAEQQRYAQMTTDEQARYQRKVQRDQELSGRNPNYQARLQQDAMEQSRALNDLAARHNAAQAAIQAKVQQVQQNYANREQRDATR